jgi:hypothetical protein
VGPPDQMTRTAILERQLARMPCATDVIITELAEWVSNLIFIIYLRLM